MDAADRLPQRGAEVEQRAGAEDGDRAAAVPDLGRPVELDDLARRERLVAEEVGELLEGRRRAGSAAGRCSQTRASWPPMKPIMIPGVPLSGETSKVTFTGPFSLTTWPVSPRSRQNGVG